MYDIPYMYGWLSMLVNIELDLLTICSYTPLLDLPLRRKNERKKKERKKEERTKERRK
jgi:hypothetical protein